MAEFKERYENFFGTNSFSKLIRFSKYYNKINYLRINISKINLTDAIKILKRYRLKYKETQNENCFIIEKKFYNISSMIHYLNGLFYLQDLSSQLPLYGYFKYLETNNKTFKKFKEKGIKILDVAAAPGSKTTQIADFLTYLNIKYNIVALEPFESRIRSLINNIQRMNFQNIKIIKENAESFVTKERFDLIIADLPCSGNLVIDKNWLKKRSIKDISQRSNLQKEILKNSFKLLKKDGILIYSTCSLEPEENEVVINWILNNFKVEIINLYNFNLKNKIITSYNDKKLKQKVKLAQRLIPSVNNIEPFFFAYFKKL